MAWMAFWIYFLDFGCAIQDLHYAKTRPFIIRYQGVMVRRKDKG